jgi:tetratricopeptide (TPR) repeat protein
LGTLLGYRNFMTNANRSARKVGAIIAAISLCAALLGLFPRIMSNLYLNQGNVHLLANTLGTERGVDESIVDTYRQSLWWNSLNAQAYHRAGYAYLQQGKVTEAISNLSEAVRLAPERKSRYSYWLGKAYEHAGRDREAIDAMLQANYLLYFEELADGYAKKGDLESAQRVYGMAIESNLRPVRAYTDLGAMFYNNGRCADAESPLMKATELDTNNARAAYYLGVCALVSGDLGKALRYSRKAVEVEPQNLYYRIGLAEVHEARGELKEAVQQWQAAYDLAPSDDSVRLRLEQARTRMSNP